MLISEIASLMNVGAANQLEPEQACIVIDAVQKAAFAHELDAFLVYDQRVVLQVELHLGFSTYAGPTAASLGGTVTGTASGATARLEAYDNNTHIWRVTPLTGVFHAGEVVTAVDGMGSISSAAGWRGPYAAPSAQPAPCRKVWGITRRIPGCFDVRTLWASGPDYGAQRASDRPFETGQVNDLDNTFTFATPPTADAELYWVYWRDAPDVTGLGDESQLRIPAAHHIQLLACCRAAATAILGGNPLDPRMIDTYLGPWLASLRAPYRDQVGYQNMTQDVGCGLI